MSYDEHIEELLNQKDHNEEVDRREQEFIDIFHALFDQVVHGYISPEFRANVRAAIEKELETVK
jgi:hypothetical protein